MRFAVICSHSARRLCEARTCRRRRSRCVYARSTPPPQLLNHFFGRLLRSSFLRVKYVRRRLAAIVLVVSLLTLPNGLINTSEFSAFASNTITSTSTPLLNFWHFLSKLFTSTPQRRRKETIGERTARVGTLRVTPAKQVVYAEESLAFAGLPTDAAGEPVAGAKLSWSSSDDDKVRIDPDSGLAQFLQPGLAWIICRAGGVEGRAPVLIKPGRRPKQTDAQWKADQDSLDEDGDTGGGSGASAAFNKMLEAISPTAYAQGQGGPLDYVWNDARNAIGNPRNRAIESTRIGSVIAETGNYNMAVPIVGLSGRGLDVGLTLSYNSKAWMWDGGTVVQNPLEGFPRKGFNLGFGYIVTYPSYATFDTAYLWIDSDGTPRYLGHGSEFVTGNYQTNDGSHIRFTGSATLGGTMTYKNGTQVTISLVNNLLQPTQVLDKNGNFIQIAYRDAAQGYHQRAIDYVVDTMGRTILFVYAPNKDLTSITAPAFGSGTRTLVQFTYPTWNPAILRTITFPATGTGYLLTYTNYGTAYNVSLRRQMSSGGDGVESASVVFNYPVGGPYYSNFTTRTESANNSPTGVYTYSVTGTGPVTTTITRPDSSQLILTRGTNGLLSQSEIKNSSGGSMTKSVIAYANDPGGHPQVQSVTNYDDLNVPTKVESSYDGYGNVTNVREYGDQIGGQWKVRRRSRTVYGTIGVAVNLVTETNVYDALENTNGWRRRDDREDYVCLRQLFGYWRNGKLRRDVRTLRATCQATTQPRQTGGTLPGGRSSPTSEQEHRLRG